MPARKRRQPGCPKITINKVQLCLRIPVNMQRITFGGKKGILLEIDTYSIKGYLECYPKEEYGNVDIFNRPVCYIVQVPLKECLSFIEEHFSRITHVSECKTSFGVYFCKKIVLSEEEATRFGVSFGKWDYEQIDTLNRKVSNNYTILKDQIKELLQRFGLESGNAFLDE
jgi:hypothetical protein